MPGKKIPMITVEKLTVRGGGGGVVLTDDATNFDVQTWTGVWVSGAIGTASTQCLPAASATAWWKVQSDGGTDYYVPCFNLYW